jgi:lysophospholipase L1-like esterase
MSDPAIPRTWISGQDPYTLIATRLAEAQALREPRPLSCFVALGDSFTAGKGCAPGESWADRLASALRAAHPRLAYRNLAVDGATSEAVLDQLGPALQLEPDLATVICGANDVLHSVRPDIAAYEDRLATIFDRLREAVPGVAILTATSPERWSFLELRPRTRARVVEGLSRLNEATRSVSAGRRIPCLDVSEHPGLDDPRNFSGDGLHPSPEGHARAAREFARALRTHFGIETATDRRSAP